MKKNQSQVQGKETTLGERPIRIYIYEALNRLIHATGKAKNASYDMAMTFGRMSEPLTKVQKVDSTTTAKSYNFAYKYEDSNHPTAPTQIGHDHYTYDANGNPTLVTNDSTNTTREMYWDEDNRLMVLSDNGKTSRYTYNAAGERIMKSYGTMEGVYINGAPQGITLTNVDFRLHQDKMSKLFCAWFALKFHETDNFTLYPASILSVNKNRFTKHYFLGDKRIASRIGTGLFNNVYGRNGSYVTAGQQDYAERMNQIQTQKEAYYKKVGVAPGVPTEKGAYGDPENTGVGYNAVLTELGNHDVPQGWIQTPKPNTTPNTNPGPPVSWNDPSNPDDPQAGYGYIANDTTKEETFFYHSDHLGSTSYITDEKGNITQYDAYLPYGELLVDEHSSSEDLPYKFNGKQFDDETGLYYYGARYMNPMASIWYGVDPLAEKYKSIGGYVYCIGNPIKLIDIDGLYPTGIISRETHKLKPAAIRLLSLVSGVEEKYIKKVVAVESSFLPSGYSMTTGSSPYKVTIHTGSNFFTSNDKKDNINILFNYAHEVGHIKQIAREYNLGSYVSKTIIKYIPFGHDASNWEQEADNGYRVLDNFWKYVQRFSRKGNPLKSLFNNDKMSEENKMRIINKWWKSWQNYMQKEADNLIKNSTLIDMKKRTKQNLTEKKKMQLS